MIKMFRELKGGRIIWIFMRLLKKEEQFVILKM